MYFNLKRLNQFTMYLPKSYTINQFISYKNLMLRLTIIWIQALMSDPSKLSTCGGIQCCVQQ